MNVKKMIKGIIGICAVSGIAVIAYKCGEDNGRTAERKRLTADDDDIDLYDDDDEEFDEPDDYCLAPRHKKNDVLRE